jgi:hypothetical protein
MIILPWVRLRTGADSSALAVTSPPKTAVHCSIVKKSYSAIWVRRERREDLETIDPAKQKLN